MPQVAEYLLFVESTFRFHTPQHSKQMLSPYVSSSEGWGILAWGHFSYWKRRTRKCRTWKWRTKCQGVKMQDLKMQKFLSWIQWATVVERRVLPLSKGPFIATQLEQVEFSWVELRRHRYRHFADATQLEVELSWVQLSCVAMNGALTRVINLYSVIDRNTLVNGHMFVPVNSEVFLCHDRQLS